MNSLAIRENTRKTTVASRCLPDYVQDNVGVVVMVGAKAELQAWGRVGKETGAGRRFRFLADTIEMSNCAQPLPQKSFSRLLK
jgi:hypothetical protein